MSNYIKHKTPGVITYPCCEIKISIFTAALSEICTCFANKAAEVLVKVKKKNDH